ncbi:MAG: hypothetical protein LBK82_10825 [Planctomycetaceae bacterium]|nr:hypothetical protein [Planctomycetaceae bacterium]
MKPLSQTVSNTVCRRSSDSLSAIADATFQRKVAHLQKVLHLMIAYF